jgi:hypothetical protein
MDDGVFRALQELLEIAPNIQRGVFLVGGTTMWDWWYATEPSLRAKDVILEEPRITKDLDLGVERRAVQIAGDPSLLRQALERRGWQLREQLSFVWVNARWTDITIELLAHINPGETGGSTVWVRDAQNTRVLRACATLRRLAPLDGLLEDCRHPTIAVFRLSRLTQLGLLLSKLIAIVVVLDELVLAEREQRPPMTYCTRLGKDLRDALQLLGGAVRPGLSNYSSRAAMQQHRKVLEDDLLRIIALSRSIPASVQPELIYQLQELGNALDQWLA